jgi:putative ABC transport system substrate-binding protein
LGRLRELGWIEGRNIAIEYRWFEGSSERSAESRLSSLTSRWTSGAIPALAAKRETSMIPIVFP